MLALQKMAANAGLLPCARAVLIDPIHIQVVLGLRQFHAGQAGFKNGLFLAHVRLQLFKRTYGRGGIAHLHAAAVLMAGAAKAHSWHVALGRDDGLAGVALMCCQTNQRGGR